LKILVLSFYYYPDLCAGSFRCTHLIEQLKAYPAEDLTIDIITTFPNRYSSYHSKTQALAFEQDGNVTIHRIKLPKHKSGMLDQSRAFIDYAKNVKKLTQGKKYDLVFATSARLMTAGLAVWIARKQQAKLYLDIRDIFVESIGDVLPKKISLFAKPFFSFLEKCVFSQANHINLVSSGFKEYFETRYPKVQLSYFTNGIDPEFLSVKHSDLNSTPPGKPRTILYAGNIGEGQGLHLILPELARKLQGQYEFKIIGDGGRIEQLKAATATCSNITIMSPVERGQLVSEYQKADVLFLHLNNKDAFLKVLPSKLFEYAAMGKPILAGVGGYAADFIKNEITHAAVFHPCNSQEALDKLRTLTPEPVERDSFIQKYARSSIMKLMASDIVSLVEITE
jgi:glycosyltransferase involved in cell wall biosynthesis